MNSPSEAGTATDAGELTEDQLKRARDRKLMEQASRRIQTNMDFLAEEHRQQVRAIMITGALSEEDLQRMLRSQVLNTTGGTPCHDDIEVHDDDDDDSDGEVRYTKQRFIETVRMGGPLDPVPVPRNQTLCPLHERAMSGEIVPCEDAMCMAFRSLDGHEERVTEAYPSVVALIRKAHLQPCYAFGGLAQQFLPSMLEKSWRSAQKKDSSSQAQGDADLDTRRLFAAEQALLTEEAQVDRVKEQAARASLNYLLDTGRLTDSDLTYMIYLGVIVTDEGWLPCRDDPFRILGDISGETEESSPNCDAHWRKQDRNPRHRHCPLHDRALRGDRTVPCREALSVKTDPDRVEKEEKYWQWIESRGGKRPTLPQSDRIGEEDGPGGPKDPVLLLRMRPCHLVGQVLAASLYPVALHLRHTPEPKKEDP